MSVLLPTTYYLDKVKKDPYYLQHIPAKDQTEAICLEAVKQNGFALEFVEKQTEEICLEAIRRNEEAVKYVNPDIITRALVALLSDKHNTKQDI